MPQFIADCDQDRLATRQPLGRIVATTGSQIVALLDDVTPDGATSLQVGALVTVLTPRSRVFGLVSGLSIPMPMADGKGHELKIVEIDLMGEIAGGGTVFRRGVSLMPSLDDQIALANEGDKLALYAQLDGQTACIGTLYQAPAIGAHIRIDDLLGNHFAIVGATGTGKSCGLTVILKQVIEKAPNAHILLIDPHGEYASAFGGQAEHLTSTNLELPYWLFSFEEILAVVYSGSDKSSADEAMRLRELILAAKLRFAGNRPELAWMTADSPVPYAMADLDRLLDDAMGKLENRGDVGPYLRIKARLAALRTDRRYGFMFPTGIFVHDNLVKLLGRLFRVPVNGKPVAILDLAGVPAEILNVVVSVLCRLAFDFAAWGGQKIPLLLVCEEAHRYAPQDAGVGFEPTTRALSRIAKEGRKYGISLCVVTQRPSELAPALLSQCNTVFAMRLSNQSDQSVIQSIVSDEATSLLASLPSLNNRETIVIGEGIAMPMRVRFVQLSQDERPRSDTVSYLARWSSDEPTAFTLNDIVDSWRRQKLGE